ncbi:trypsin-like serine peptidase [Isoptericola sediminis]|uniref:Serine protease n=1 Tax=Isoptericola sediminis TaxID=2733572 RepID=A0A849K587_9MICO|nr:hypothetical protein [Isoptericola sediminis]NNU27570.1 hypothetical protein [Isoptericola sediminis]
MRQDVKNPSSTLLNTTVVGQPWADAYQVGAGVDAVTGQLRSSAIEKPTLTPSKNQRTEYSYALMESQKDLEQLVETSLKGSYNIEGVKTSASTSFLEKVVVSELAVTIVAAISVEDSEYSLAPDYVLAVTPGPDFRERHGDYFVAGYRAGSSLYAVYQCRFSSTEKRQEFAAALSAEVPDVLSAEGSVAFQKVASSHEARVNVDVVVDGVRGTLLPPKDGWTPGTIISEVIPWFIENLVPVPLESYLEHYRMIDPEISGEVPIAPSVFADLSYLYSAFWVARSRERTCPAFGKGLVSGPFERLRIDLEAHQASLATDPESVRKYTGDVEDLLGTLDEIDNRQAFYSQVVKAAATEPAKGHRIDADKGTVRWGYGFQAGTRPGVDVRSEKFDYKADAKAFGWQDHGFTYRNTSRVVVGWDVVCQWNDFGGDWEKRSDRIIGRDGGTVWVKSDYWRSCYWSVTFHTVDASLYPVGPWTADAVHSSGFTVHEAPQVTPVEEYWTAERMRAATPVDRSTAHEGALAVAVRPQDVGPSETVTAEATTTPVAAFGEYPARTVGKLFFVMGDQDCVASGVVVHRSGIMTAAHCLVMDHEAHSLVFVPAYIDGEAPYGRWPVPTVAWPDAWPQGRSTADDLGFGRVATAPDGTEIGDVVGWVGITTRPDVGRWDDVGYPAQAIAQFPFDGQRPWQSSGARLASDEERIVAKADDLTAGGSGGPWFASDDATAVNGVFSTYNTSEHIVWSPEFAEWVLTFYRHCFG